MMEKQRTILIVDDCLEDREVYRRYLSGDSTCTYKIFEAEDGKDGLQLCKQLQPDVILVDYSLPDINGIDFLSELKAQTGCTKLPVAMLIGQGNEANAATAINNGAQNYLVKENATQQCFRLAIDNTIERNCLQRQLEQSEERFRTSVENMLDCFAIYKSLRDESGNIIDFLIEYVNEKACQSHRRSENEQIGKKLGELLPAHRENGLVDEYFRVVETGETFVKEAFVYSDIDEMHVSKTYDIRAAKMNDGVVVTWRDITERKQTEEALQESQQFIQRIAESIPGIVYLHDLIEQRNVYINGRITKLLGYSPEEVIAMGEKFTPSVMHPDDFALLPAHLERFNSAKDGEILNFEYRMQHASGEWRWFYSRDTVFARTDQGLARQILGTAIDITDRKQTEENLRQSQQFIQRIADTMPGLLYVYDLIEKRNIYVNSQIVELLGYTPQQIQAMGSELFPLLMHPEDLKRLPAVLEQLRTSKNDEVISFEYRLRHQDGSWRWFYGRDTVFTRTADGLARQIIGTAQDITERKQTEEKLRRVNERFELAATAVKCLIYDWDLKNNIVERSGELMELCGYLPQEAEPTKDWWRERIHPEDMERLQRELGDIPQANRYAFEYRVRNKNEEYLYVFDQGLIIRDEEGRAVRVVGSTIDISDRKIAQLEIQRLNRELERRVSELQTLLDVLPVGIAIAQDPKCEDIRVNTFLQQMLSLAPETNASKTGPNADILPYKLLSNGEEIPGEKLPMQEAAASGVEVPNSEYQVIRADGATFDLLGHAKPLFDEQGQVRGCVGAYMDISDRKKTEAALRQSEERYRYLAEAMPQFVWISDAQGRCYYVNQRWCEYSGLTLEQTETGAWQADVFHPDDLQRCNEDWAKAMESGAIFEGEYRFKRASDGAYRWFLVRSVPIKDDFGRIVKWFGTSTDIEEQKQIQAERDRLLSIEQTSRAEAEAANRAKDDFVAMVSHDLRAPLNSILGWAQLLRTRKFDDAARLRALETIERNAKSQAKLLEDLLDVSRMIQGKLQIHLYPVELRSLVETAIDTAYPPATEKKIRLELAIDASICTISGDSNRMQQVLANLLTNAIKFTPEGGKIEVKLEKLQIADCRLQIETKNSRSNLQSAISNLQLNYAQITVSDTGQGISPDFLPHVFDRFRQSSSGSKKGGLGLGLAIARHLIELHGGTIEAHSAGIGQGATFTIKLPLVD